MDQVVQVAPVALAVRQGLAERVVGLADRVAQLVRPERADLQVLRAHRV